MVAAALPPWDLSFLAWIALIPWLQALSRAENLLRATVQGLWLGFSIGLLGAHWIADAAHEFLELSWPLSIVVLMLFSATCAQPHLILVAPVVRWADRRLGSSTGSKNSLLFCLCLALVYTSLDAFVPRLFDAGLGYALHGSARLRQVADIGGVSLLTFLIVLVNLLAWRIWIAARARDGRGEILISHGLAIGLIWVTALAYGTFRSNANARALAEADSFLQVGIVQGNVPNETRLAWARGDERAAEKQLSTYMLLTEQLAEQTPRPELIVWPEATFPGVFLEPGSTLQRGRANKFDRQIMRLRRPLVFGAYDSEREGERRILYNALFAITPRYDKAGAPGVVGRYRKHELLAFAEHIPGISQSDWFRRHLPSLGFFGAGPGAGRFEVTTPDGEQIVLGPIICSESLHAGHVIDTARGGSSILLNVGSDGWFGHYGEPQFHLAIARLRSVETRLPQVRAANTGISALILPGGEISARTELGAETVLNGSIPLIATDKSLMMRWGDWFGVGSLAGGFLLLIVLVLRERRRM